MPQSWKYLHLRQGSLFSLRLSKSTNKGGMSLPVPTPFAIKMALLDRIIKLFGRCPDKDEFEFIRDLDVRIKPPDYIAISGHTVKILDLKRGTNIFQTTVIYREYVYWQGELVIAFGSDSQFFDWFDGLCLGLNYIGKKGGFVQPVKIYSSNDEPGVGFSRKHTPGNLHDKGFIIAPLDDMGKGLTFDKISPYNTQQKFNINERERFIVPTRLPLKLVKTASNSRVFVRTNT